jgi:DNA-binding PadR family transcriptional regulator
MRRTVTLQRVARVLLTEAGDPHWGYELAAKAGVNHAAVYPMLAKLTARGYLTAEPPVANGTQPPRRPYRLTRSGMEFFTQAAQGPIGRRRRSNVPTSLPVVEAVRQGRLSLAGGVLSISANR